MAPRLPRAERVKSGAKFNLYLELTGAEDIGPEAIAERVKFIYSHSVEIKEEVNKLASVTDKNWLQAYINWLLLLSSNPSPLRKPKKPGNG